MILLYNIICPHLQFLPFSTVLGIKIKDALTQGGSIAQWLNVQAWSPFELLAFGCGWKEEVFFKHGTTD